MTVENEVWNWNFTMKALQIRDNNAFWKNVQLGHRKIISSNELFESWKKYENEMNEKEIAEMKLVKLELNIGTLTI